ncbi:MAG: type II toxin-antitoxin system Phd/YefM family antitoxin [Brevundimonas sp.]|nr:MAG: type II toxin-antitoxin system Phd/YefM family antitoxin [Brevundimonas sp.]
MATYGVAEAKNNFTHLLERVEGGERIVITRHGKPVAEIVRTPVTTPTVDLERRRVAIEKLRKMRERLPPATQTSVELLHEMYDDKPW